MKVKYFIAILLCLFIAFISLGLYNGLRIQEYEVDAENIENHIKIALITDLHSCSYGEDESALIDLLDKESPDLVMLAGDIFDDVISNDNTVFFLENITKKYPCYYVTGNHEYWSGRSAFEEKMQILKNFGVIHLSAEMEILTINNETINICGVDDPDAAMIASRDRNYSTLSFEEQIEKVKKLSDNANYTILLSHRPEYLDRYVTEGFDLVLSGHAHGGQWRIPGLVNGVYAPNQGWFPKYAGGKYIVDNTTMIVSRGLAKESTRIPRFYNRPEVVLIDLY
ncbi:metallophosphoesterase [Niameybacter massiliensis]|uniref:Metallophosphoesterase n=1 Tax=Holtiella tumoricola TaxID=3018743 RepID=A0AA42J0C9_9FIRM|nr:metallophosphoesterase [Holtiella tumoricola]MDA3731357.1 metallophosphoesterase [Holtiella tumoricola]